MDEKVEVKLVVSGGSQFKSSLSSAERQFSNASRAMGSIAKKVAAGVAAIGTVMVGVGVAAVKAAGRIEQQEVAFKTLLGSTEAATAALNRIKKDAMKTPFDMPGLVDANQRLISAGINANRAADIILTLGDAVSATGGSNEELSRMVANFQQIKSVGRASLMDIRQFAMAGIPIFDMLSDSLGVSKSAIANMVSEGTLGFGQLEKAFRDASAEGGRFSGAMEDQSLTLQGIMSNIKDTIGILLTDFARDTGLFDSAKSGLAGILDWLLEIKDSEAWNNFVDEVKKGLNDVSVWWTTEGKPFIDGFIEGWSTSSADAYFEQLREQLRELKRENGDTSANVGKSWGETLKEMLAGFEFIGLQAAISFAEVKKAFKSLLDGSMFRDAFNIAAAIVQGWLNNVSVKIRTAFSLIGSAIPNAIKPALNRVIDYINAFLGTMNRSILRPTGIKIPGIPHFASGGIVPGSSAVGDRVIARVNSGEMVLNKGQQSGLFSFIKSLQSQPTVINNNISGNNFGGNRGQMQMENNFVNLLINASR